MNIYNFALLCGLAATLGTGMLGQHAAALMVSAEEEIATPSVSISYDLTNAKFYRNTEQSSASIEVSSLTDYSERDGFYDFTSITNGLKISEAEGNKDYRVFVLPITISVHVEAYQEITFSAFKLNIKAEKVSFVQSQAGCMAELLSPLPSSLDTGTNKDSPSSNSLGKSYVDKEKQENPTECNIGACHFINYGNTAADIPLSGEYYFAFTVRYASQHNHEGFAELSLSGSSVYSERSLTDDEIIDHFVANELHFTVDPISTSDHRDTNACRGEGGYYDVAKTVFNSFTPSQKGAFCTQGKYEDARERLNAWAVANGESLNTSTHELQKASKISVSRVDNPNNDAGLLILALGLVFFALVSSIGFILHRKHSK